MPAALPESKVVKIWREQLPGRTDLVTEDGGPVRIVYPGRLNGDRGPDYRDAVIDTGHGFLMGDVEIHVRSSGWRAHRHHRDPAYNRVILHVVFWHDVTGAVTLQNGKRVPTLALDKFIGDDTGGPSLNYPLPCRSATRRWDTDFMGGVLDNAGEQRFLARVDEFRREITRTGASQSLYRGIMGALGYSKNKQPMLELAGRMPLRRLEAAASKGITAAECLARFHARLLGMAGLLPSQRAGWHQAADMADSWLAGLEGLWAGCRETATMSEDDWHFFKVRPGNLPTRRIAAMACLLVRYKTGGLLAGPVASLGEVASEMDYRKMERALLVTDDDYRGICGVPGFAGGSGFPALLGRERAADIAVNVLLPFTVAWGRLNSRPELAAGAAEIYRSYPALADNTLQRHMTDQLGIGRYVVGTARRQQGLLHIYKTRCSQGGCRDCPVGSAGN
jgi:hypothetical protein